MSIQQRTAADAIRRHPWRELAAAVVD